MRKFVQILNGASTEHFITRIKNGLVYYGLYLPGHENKKSTGVMSLELFEKLKVEEQTGKTYIDGVIPGRWIPYTRRILE